MLAEHGFDRLRFRRGSPSGRRRAVRVHIAHLLFFDAAVFDRRAPLRATTPFDSGIGLRDCDMRRPDCP